MNDIGAHYLETVRALLQSQKRLADRALAQLSDAQLHEAPGPDANSVAVIMQHIVGNMRSRWTDFLTSDGEKSWRQRDAEFEDQNAERDALSAEWEAGWRCLFDAIDSLTSKHLSQNVTIRGEAHTVIEAIERQVSHYGYHVGQLVFVARLVSPTNWISLSVPKGRSADFNRTLGYEAEPPTH